MKTVYEYLKESESVLNSMKPFVNMKVYDEISVTYKIRNLKADIVTHPWKAATGFQFFDFSLDNFQFNGVSIKDCIFVSIEIVENGLLIECKTK